MDTTDAIDALLERYLHLLHEYTTLREQLNALQAGTYQNIARANFAAERGMRYGQDHYDERMQASRRVGIAVAATAAEAVPSFTIIHEKDKDSAPSLPSSADEVSEAEGSGGLCGSSEKKGEDNAAKETDEAKEDDTESADDRKKKKTAQKDPLRWFGLLTPMALRQAQAQSVQAVEEVIPRLVSVDSEMAQLEIEVRRARKKRAKAEMTAAKEEQQHEPVQSNEITV